jgi:hypothetical protein
MNAKCVAQNTFFEDQQIQRTRGQVSSFLTCCHQGILIITLPNDPQELLISPLTGDNDRRMPYKSRCADFHQPRTVDGGVI